MKSLPLAIMVFSLALVSAAAGYFLYRAQPDPEAAALPPVGTDLETKPRPKPAAMVGRKRPDFSLPSVDGAPRHIGEWHGKVIALNFWATWCPPCLKEIPEFVHLQEKYADQGLQFIGVALQAAEPVRQFMQEHNMNYPVLFGELEVINIARAYGNDIGALPYTVIIDRSGRIVFVKPGPLSGEVAEAVISALL